MDQPEVNSQFLVFAFQDIMKELRAIRQAIESLNEIATMKEISERAKRQGDENLSRYIDSQSKVK